jgi:hypothetical protein
MTPHQAACAAAQAATELLPDDDQPPVLQWVGPAGVLSVVLPTLDHALGLAANAGAPASLAEAITLVADSYHATVEYDPTDAAAAEAADAVRRGDLADRYRAGDPTVTDALVVITVHRTPPTADMTVLPYRRQARPGWPTTIEWDAQVDHHGATVVELQGRVADHLRLGLDTAARQPYPPDTELEAWTYLATLMAAAGLLAEVTPR